MKLLKGKTCTLPVVDNTVLTEQETKIKKYISKGLTHKQIQKQLNISKRTLFFHLKSMKSKGYLGSSTCTDTTPPVGEGTLKSDNLSNNPVNHLIRLHGQQFLIEILYNSKKYNDNRKRQNRRYLDFDVIELNEDTIEVYVGRSFFNEHANDAHKESMEYFLRLLRRLENDYGIILLKDRKQNIKEVVAHFSEIKNGISYDYRMKNKVLLFKAADGKVWLKTDNSFNLDELETTHPKTAKQDMNILKHYLNDFRENEPPNNTELLTIMLKHQSGTDKRLEECASATLNVLSMLDMFLKPFSKPPTPQNQDVEYIPNYIG